MKICFVSFHKQMKSFAGQEFRSYLAKIWHCSVINSEPEGLTLPNCFNDQLSFTNGVSEARIMNYEVKGIKNIKNLPVYICMGGHVSVCL